MRLEGSRSGLTALAVRAVILVAVGVGGPVRAETVIAVDGTIDLGYSRAASQSRGFTDLRPAFTLQFGSPRFVWRAGYLFSGELTLWGGAPNTNWYSNRAELSLAAELSPRTSLSVDTSVLQGGTAFQLTSGAPDAAQPTFRVANDPTLLTGTLGESLAWQASPAVRLRQDLTGSVTAPQDALRRANGTMEGALTLDRSFLRDAVGGVFRSALSVLRPQLSDTGTHLNFVTNSLSASWNHDFDATWNGQVIAGVEHAARLGGRFPGSILPTGTVVARYLSGNTIGSFSITHGVSTNLQLGTVSLSDTAVLGATVTLDPVRSRQIAGSVGFLHAGALQDAPASSSTAGDSAHGEIAVLWGLTDLLLGNVRYSVSYQFGGSSIATSLAHVVLVGVVLHYSNARFTPPVPAVGRRVDGTDAVGFPGGVRNP